MFSHSRPESCVSADKIYVKKSPASLLNKITRLATYAIRRNLTFTYTFRSPTSLPLPAPAPSCVPAIFLIYEYYSAPRVASATRNVSFIKKKKRKRHALSHRRLRLLRAKLLLSVFRKRARHRGYIPARVRAYRDAHKAKNEGRG